MYVDAWLVSNKLNIFHCNFRAKNLQKWTYENNNGIGDVTTVINDINKQLEGKLTVEDGRGQGCMSPNFSIYPIYINVPLTEVLGLLASIGMKVVVEHEELRNFLGLSDDEYREESYISNQAVTL